MVVGGGTAGLVAAAGAAGLGARVALVERHLMGGDCLVTRLRALEGGASAPRARPRGAPGGRGARRRRCPADVAIDFGAVMERMRRIRAEISHHDSAWRFRRELGVDVFLGERAFTGPDAVEVDGRTLRFAKAVIATGARAGHPPIPGLAEAGTSRTRPSSS